MTGTSNEPIEITPQVLLKAYACGIFPMAENAHDNALYWIDPDRRGVIPLDDFHMSRRLRRVVRQARFEVRVDSAFDDVIAHCAAPARGRRSTWINDRIRRLYAELHEIGHCHTVECWADGQLAGGLYGVNLGRAFFGESMFSLVTDASKVALVHLAARLKAGGFSLLDTQFVTDHLKRFGAVELSRDAYHALLEEALKGQGDFYCMASDLPPDEVLQVLSQTS